MTASERGASVGENAEPYWGARWNEKSRVPVQSSPTTRDIPESIARMAYEEYARNGHDQTFERLHARGGFSWAEVVMLLADRCNRLSRTPSAGRSTPENGAPE